MAKMAILLPREEMLASAKTLVAQMNLDVVALKTIVTACAKDELEEAIAAGAELIVARGIQASIIKHNTDIPVIEVRLTGQEIALLITQCIKKMERSDLRIGIICFENMLSDTIYFEQIFGVEICNYFVEQPAQLESAARQAIDDGVDIIIGGDFVNDYCRSIGFPTIFLNSTQDSLRTALQNAKSVSYAAELEKKNTAHMETLLNYSFNGIIELDNIGQITNANYVARQILKQEKEIIGCDIFSLMPAADAQIMRDAFEGGSEIYSNVVSLCGVSVVANVAPVLVDGSIDGSIFSFYEMQKLVRLDENALRERYLHRHVAAGNFDRVVHKSKEMNAAVKLARSFAQSDAPILLHGELGTEKEIFAQCIHNNSSVAKGPFVTFACDGVDGVSAVVNGIGDKGSAMFYLDHKLCTTVKLATNGTIYLRNVESLSLPSQQTLVRIILDKVINLPGEEYPIPVKTRIVASCRKSLYPLVVSGAFREDLYYLLNPMSLSLPPLRDRKEDFTHILQGMIDECCRKYNRYIVLTTDARKRIMEYNWPGNLIQLEYFVQRMLTTTPSRTVNDSYVIRLLDQLYPQQGIKQADDTIVVYKNPEAARLTELLDKHKGNRGAVAEELGISKTTLWRRMKKLGVYNKYDI